jgi:Ca2+-binding EF-hand superfamily protein
MVEDGVNLDLSAIQVKKEEARKLLETYRDNNETMDMEAYIELEQQFLRESAREQLAMR